MDVYIVAAKRTAVGKAPRGMFKTMRPDDLGAEVIKDLMKSLPQLDSDRIDDVICGNAAPEAEQGLNMGRMIGLMGLNNIKVPGVTVNRYCSSGLETIALGAAKINAGMADCIIAGGAESLSLLPFSGWRVVPNSDVAKTHPDWYTSMGLTAEAVARDFKISREAQDQFAYTSNMRAVAAIKEGKFKAEITPIKVKTTTVVNDKQVHNEFIADTDEGPRASTTVEGLAQLKPVFTQGGSVTAGNASQTSDGAAFVILMSGKMVKELNIEPIARFVTYAVSGVEPRIMGIGPIEAIPKALKQADKKLNDINLFELNEAFASQSLAIINHLGLNQEIVNVNGGAIALGHPLGCTGGKLSVQLFNEMRRRELKNKYGMVTMCIGAGQGAAGIFEFLN